MKKALLTRLQALDSHTLAQALFDLAKRSDEAERVVDRLTRTSGEAYTSTKHAISSLMRASGFIDWHDIHGFVQKLENIIEDIAQLDITHEQRFELICRFYETEDSTFDRVDDSSGEVGDVYRGTAQELFTNCAAAVAITDQALVVESLERLLSSNKHGVRDSLLSSVVSVLDESTCRKLITSFSRRSDLDDNEYSSKQWLHHVMTLADHLGDTHVFEITALESVADYDEVPTDTKYTIASNYFKHNDFSNTKRWMDEIDASNTFMQSECNKLLVALHDKMGNTADRDRVAFEEFDSAPSKRALDTLLVTIGEECRSNIVDKQVQKILTDIKFFDRSFNFLIDTGCIDVASEYTIKHRESIDGDCYWHLPRGATKFVKSGNILAAICIYRALTDSILRRGYTKSYYYGIRYLVKLDELADVANVAAVPGMVDHETYKKCIYAAHRRKHSFWSKYAALC